MKKRILFFEIMLLMFFTYGNVVAQQTNLPELKTYRVAIFAPLYLDSTFNDAGVFKYGRTIPKFVLPGLEFMDGVQIALDSIKIWNANVEAIVYDSKSLTQPIASLIKEKTLNQFDLIIGSVKDAEYKQLANFVGKKNIPFVSATYPNDGGVTCNSSLVILNPTLKAHCEAIYTYLLQNHGEGKIFICRKKGIQEDKVAGYFKALNEQDGSSLINMQTIFVDSTFSADDLKYTLDSTHQSYIIGASLDETFATKLTDLCKDLSDSYPIALIGMPNWESFKSLYKDDFEDFPIYITTPYINNKWDSYSKQVSSSYYKKYKKKPTDMVYKGYEAAYVFTKLLLKHPKNLISHLNDKSVKVFTEYNFRAVMARHTDTDPDYYENKHLYFAKILNGEISKAW